MELTLLSLSLSLPLSLSVLALYFSLQAFLNDYSIPKLAVNHVLDFVASLGTFKEFSQRVSLFSSFFYNRFPSECLSRTMCVSVSPCLPLSLSFVPTMVRRRRRRLMVGRVSWLCVCPQGSAAGPGTPGVLPQGL